jgi:hypothetical protein
VSDADLHSNTRRVTVTHDGRRIGHTVPLETEYALRLAISRKLNYRKFMESAEARGRRKGSIGAAQKISAAKKRGR